MRNINEEHIENEIPKYKKKKKSSTSKSFNKTKHKHDYSLECIAKYPPFYDGGKPIYYLTMYCSICGKIGRTWNPMTEVEINGTKYTVMMGTDELLEKYKHLEIIEMSEHFQKYIPIVVKSE